MTKEEMIESIMEFINDTKECMADTPSGGIAGTILQPHSVLKQQIKDAEAQIEKLKVQILTDEPQTAKPQ